MPDEALETKMEDEVLDDIFKKLPHDRRRVYYAGFSGGAYRSYHLTARRTEPIAGIVAYGGWIGGEKFYKLPFRKGMAVAMVNGANDEAANSWANRDAPPLKKRNCEVKAFDFPGGHQLPPKETTEASLQWIDEEWTKQSLKK
jgi:predicted esterase